MKASNVDQFSAGTSYFSTKVAGGVKIQSAFLVLLVFPGCGAVVTHCKHFIV